VTLESPGIRQQVIDSLINARKQLLTASYQAVAMNEAKIENYLAKKVVDNPNELSGARPAGASAPANTTSAPATSTNTGANTNAAASNVNAAAKPVTTPAATTKPAATTPAAPRPAATTPAASPSANRGK
jgi:hypothetical protein